MARHRRPATPLARAGARAVARLARETGRLAGRLPDGPAQALGAGLGRLAYWLLPGRRRVALENLALVYGDQLPPAAREVIARGTFRHLGLTAVECCRLFFGPPGTLLDRVRMEGIEHLHAAMAEGRGAFFLTAHFGNWELLAAAHQLAGYPLSVVVRPLDNPYLDALLTRARERSRLRVIPKRDAVRGILAALARRECVGILLDQDAGPDGAFVPFLGPLASTSRSLAVLALKTRAPVIPAFLERGSTAEYRLMLEPAIPPVLTGPRSHDVDATTARYAAAIARHVRACPEQWFWVHRRWKTRPG